ncbi:MAG: hypothetical protein JJU06_00275 [Ectothiorhodospiraceae bacterium]|nr:hypothetical protein [Ectothiorhodospiraceae bacterium]MCH8503921.1 hypothetical protein [Ectothiorhodospiraceae bacterium]
MIAPTHPMQLVVGLILWSVWFVALYGGLSVGCAVAPPAEELGAANWLNLSLLVLTAVTLLPLLYWTRLCWRAGLSSQPGSTDRFIALVSSGVHLITAIATLAIGLTVLTLPPCV